MNGQDASDPGDGPQAEAEIAALLRAAGPRPVPPSADAAEVRRAVEAAWRDRVVATGAAQEPSARSPRRPLARRVVPWLAAASLALVAGGLWWTGSDVGTAPGAAFAQVARLEGTAQRRTGPGAAWQPVARGTALRRGDELRTAASAAVALRRADGLELRLGSDTLLAFADGDSARLDSGRVYVDAGRTGSDTGAFVLQTARGTVRHLGTQYQAVLAPDGTLDVAVREGSIAVAAGGGSGVTARAGEQLRIAADGLVRRGTVARHGEAWEWAEGVAPSFAIDGRSLDEFLGWAARETGRQLVYASAQVARTAEATRLRGSVEGLAPAAAVDAVLATAPELRHAFAGAQLRIEAASDPTR